MTIHSPPQKWASGAFKLVNIIVYIYLAYGLLLIAGESTILNSITDFNQHMRILTPYMSGHDRDLLISEWSQMRGFDDYQNIYGKIIEIAEINDLKLYRNHHY
jgi:hypothetical protein